MNHFDMPSVDEPDDRIELPEVDQQWLEDWEGVTFGDYTEALMHLFEDQRERFQRKPAA